jgi:hypothetical protein
MGAIAILFSVCGAWERVERRGFRGGDVRGLTMNWSFNDLIPGA